ncbi:GMC oxidoreductase [Sphingobium sp. SCG-1]|uniref:GMC family oxidoreductase n=1 Tax=Sphingobium sp. SCG-1 TaxID=2072936 RepID=UPI000CD69EB8|nr:GMC family oxidoreductase N-terminal domain-containing protein [Sphingobium sp. SCG-1]AUW59688.1 GMC oxidoreductase [Sphingobium sp. SCG-1]
MAAFDYIIVGAGSAGCVLANRLSEDPRNNVLLLEEGPKDQSWLVRMPKGNGKTLSMPRYTAYNPTTRIQASGREIWVRGKLLGGSSSINGMVWMHGQPEDYDAIAALGNAGWSWADIEPCFRKLEDHELGGGQTRGAGGPIPIRLHPPTPLGDAFIAAGAALGLPKKDDINGLPQEGIGYSAMNIDGEGRRCSAARAFLQPARGRRNLSVVTGVRVDRLRFEGHRVVGVECIRGRETITYSASGEVILSAGTIGTPRLLQLSGVGPADHIKACGVSVVHDLPGVGANLREHFLLMLNYRLKHAADSQNRCFSGPGLVKSLGQYILRGDGPMSNSSYCAAAFVRSGVEELRPYGQIMMAPWTRDWVTKKFGAQPGMNVFPYVLRPESQGSVRIQSADPEHTVRIDPNYLDVAQDRDQSIALVRYVRRLMTAAPIAPFLSGEMDGTAWAQTDEQIIQAFMEQGACGFHNCGTAAMGRGPNAVLDERLRVRGLSGLRVADLSILPNMISGNTNAPAMALAWRASDIILQDQKNSLR